MSCFVSPFIPAFQPFTRSLSILGWLIYPSSYAMCVSFCCLLPVQIEEMVEVPVVLELASDLLDRHCPIFR